MDSEQSKEFDNRSIDFVIRLLKEAGIEIEGLKRQNTLSVIGESVNDAYQCVGSTPDGSQLALFIKFFPAKRSLEAAQTNVVNELKAVQRLEAIAKDLSYRIIASSIETPVVVTETLPDSAPLSYYFNGNPNSIEAHLIQSAIQLMSFIHHQAKMTHGDALPRNFSLLLRRQLENPDDPFRSLAAIDFEKAQFQEDLTAQEFE